MNPGSVEPEQWERIGRVLVSLAAFVGLAMTAGLALLLGRGVIPSLATTDEGVRGVAGLRRVLDPVCAIALILALVALGRAVVLAAGVLERLYPRFLI
jgi:hypothetical protein